MAQVTVKHVRNEFADLRRRQLTGENVEVVSQRFVDGEVRETRTLEILGASFVADEPTIFSTPSQEYIDRELEWYNSRSLNVNDIPGGPPRAWRMSADKDGHVNSNYGFLMFSEENYDQMHSAAMQLKVDQASRRAVAIYTRPSIQVEWNVGGRSDFVCTNAVNYALRDGKLNAVVQMRSSDALTGFKNDLPWQRLMLDWLVNDLGNSEIYVEPGVVLWQAASLHVYAHHYWVLDKYIETGEFNLPLRKAGA